MNIWDSVQRGLEKATQEAARIAKAQRLRATLESVTKQIEAQQGAIVVKAMELFKSGQLTQNELLILCQELNSAQQQFVQAQSELKQIQGQGSAANTASQGATVPPPPGYTQKPPYQTYDNAQPSLVAPPPPGVEPLTISSMSTIRAEVPPLANEQTYCIVCHTILITGNAFCHNCGTPVDTDASSTPTVRANEDVLEEKKVLHSEQTVFDAAEQATIRAEEAPLQTHQDGGT